MRYVEWIDEKGRKRRRLARDKDSDEVAMKTGIPYEPPDLDRLDWDQIVTDLHNALYDRGLLCWKDVQRSQNGVTSAILSIIRKRVINLYREK